MKKPKSMYSSMIAEEMMKTAAGKERYSRIDHNYDKELYMLGTEFAKAGINLENVGEYAKNKSFLNGYNRGLRLLKIEEKNNKTGIINQR